VPVCDSDEASQSRVVTSFVEDGFVDNLSELSEESILQLDGPIDKYPQHKHQSAASAPSSGQPAAVAVGANSPCGGSAEVAACCSVETVGNEAEKQDVNHNRDVPAADATAAENSAIDSVSAVNLTPVSSRSPSVDNCTVNSNDDDIPFVCATTAQNSAFDSVSAVNLLSASSPPLTNVYPLIDDCLLGSVNNGSGIPVVDVVLAAENSAFDSDSALILTSPPPAANGNLHQCLSSHITG